MAETIFVFCDDPSHPRRVAITNFVAVPGGIVPGGRWHEVPASRARVNRTGTGYHLLADGLAEAGWALDPDNDNADLRSKHDLTCRKCHKPFEPTAEKLYRVLDGWREAGVSELSLKQIVASME